MPSVNAILSAGALFFSMTNAHMKLKTPAPYGNPNNSPLDPSGSDFPCKQGPGVYDPAASENKMAIGEDQILSFVGSAVHGGGSCQISLTTDPKPTKSSKWQVIHSIEGGCPSSVDGNLPPVPGAEGTGDGATKFKYQIPQGIKPGQYTLAWTWFNKIGNREMYMNCAPITVTGGSKKRDGIPCDDMPSNVTQLMVRDTTFPDMFVANIPTSDCRTDEGGDVAFPSPGASVEKAGSGQMKPPVGPKCGAATGGSTAGGSTDGSSSGKGSGSGSTGSGSTGSGSGSGSTGASSAAAPSASGSAGGADTGAGAGGNPFGGSGSGSGSGSDTGSGTASSAAPAPVAASSAPAAAAPAPASTGSASTGSTGSTSSTGSTGGAGTSSCDSPGQSICSPDGTKIGTCDTTKQVTWIPVASGTKCSNGLMVMAAAGKRSAKFRI